MNRRNFSIAAVAALASTAVAKAASAQQRTMQQPSEADADRSMADAMKGPRLQIAMLIYPQFTAQDLIGPHTMLASLMNCEVQLVWKAKIPVPLDRGGTAISATQTLDECPENLDVLFVPGGATGTVAVMQDRVVLDFLADRGSRARYVTSVCTGSIVLGCAGLLQGYRATSHWAFRELLPSVGATRVDARVVEDRNRITGAGVTSGLDFGLTLAARLRGQSYAEMLQLINEYDPQPPFDAGSPQKAGPGLTAHLKHALQPVFANAQRAIAERSKA